MRLLVLAIGQRLPAWAQSACDEYGRRFPPDLRFELKSLKAETRDGRPPVALMSAERLRLEAACPKACRRVVLDERGDRVTTSALAARLQAWREDGRDVALLVGGADGLDADLRAGADESLRLSDLTLPHALARVLLVEALYRAWTVTIGHPYHRE